MKYSWASITESCTNFGNYQIEYTLKKILKEEGFTQETSFSFDAFKIQSPDTIDKINKTDFLILPGCTTLTIKHYPGIKSILEKVKVPVYNFGGAFFGEPDEESLKYYKYIYQPIGTRDPITSKFLADNKVPNIMIGCPTLFSGGATSFINRQNNKIVYLFGLTNIDKQIELLKKLIAKNYEITFVVQEDLQREYVKALPIKIISYRPEDFINEVSQARLVITGRLHGALPALANGTPVFFTQTVKDSRFSLLNYLNIKIFSIEDPKIFELINEEFDHLNIVDSQITFKRIEELRNNFRKYIRDFLKKEKLT